MPVAHLSRSIDISPQFFTTVFTYAFIFSDKPTKHLKETKLNAAEKRLALLIHKSQLYNSSTWDVCADIMNQLSDTYHWEGNSDGPLFFAGAVMYLLRFKGENVAWFRQQVLQARESLEKPRKKSRAIVIVPTDEGILLTTDHEGLLLIPGGNVEPGELPIAAAARELYEETGLKAQMLEFLFEEMFDSCLHQVFIARRYTGVPWARSDALELIYLDEAACAHGQFPEQLSKSHTRIIQKYQFNCSYGLYFS